MIHSYNQFHAAGHGTFFSGQLKFGREENSFLWVYDCGSKRPTRINALVADLKEYTRKDLIDMLCISHFDGDHVNGLKQLLRDFRVERLFLPYLPFKKRLEIACELDLDIAGSTDAMLFTLDPIGFLASRDLANRVGKVVFVRGGEGEGGAPPIDINEFTSPDNPGSSTQDKRKTGDEYAQLLSNGMHISTSIISHASPVTVGGLWEFVFYNKELPEGGASTSKQPLSVIQNEILDVLEKWDLTSGGAKRVEGWLKDLRNCYNRHFGARSRERNDISLCLYSAPLEGLGDPCNKFPFPRSVLDSTFTYIPVSSEQRAILLTGDINLTQTMLNDLETHLKSQRWGNIYVMQIPHHGSRHSWEIGIAMYYCHGVSVFCVPDYDKSRNHPSACVVEDLKDKRPVFANYSTSVIYCFHAYPTKDAVNVKHSGKRRLNPRRLNQDVW